MLYTSHATAICSVVQYVVEVHHILYMAYTTYCAWSKLKVQAIPLPDQLHCQQGTKPSEWSLGYKPFHSLQGLF